MLIQMGMDRCRTPEELKAWSQNIGHESVLTTFKSYGTVSDGRQKEIFQRLRQRGDAVATDNTLSQDEADFVRQLFARMKEV